MRPPATCAPRSPPTRPASVACRRSLPGTARDDRPDMSELLDYTERRTRAELATLPLGSYEAEGSVDNDGYTGEPVRLAARVTIGPQGVHFDLEGSDPAAPRTRQLDLRDDLLGLRLHAQVPDRSRPAGQRRLLPADHGRRARGHRDERTLAGGRRRRLGDTFAAGRGAVPRAARGAPQPDACGNERDDVPGRFREPRRSGGQYSCFYETFAGGYGGRAASDGPDAVQTHGQNTENAPIEETELNYPVRIGRLELVEDSGGAGRSAGGLGLRKDYLFDRPTTYTILADRDRVGPWGRSAASRHHRRATSMTATVRDAARLEDDRRARGRRRDQVRTCGGGGYGLPEANTTPSACFATSSRARSALRAPSGLSRRARRRRGARA